MLVENFEWNITFTQTGSVELRIKTGKELLEWRKVRVKVTKNVLDELEKCYKDVMAACYPELDREDIFFGNINRKDIFDSDNMTDWEISEIGDLCVSTSIESMLKNAQLKYVISISRSYNGVEIDILNNGDSKKIALEETSIDKRALVASLKQLIYFMEQNKELEATEKLQVADELVIKEDGTYKLPYKVGNRYVYFSIALKDFDVFSKIERETEKKGYGVLTNPNLDGVKRVEADVIRRSISGSDFYIVLISSNYINTYPYAEEMAYAIGELGKKCIPVYLENVELPHDMKQYIGTCENAVYQFKYKNSRDFYNELFSENRLVPRVCEPKTGESVPSDAADDKNIIVSDNYRWRIAISNDSVGWHFEDLDSHSKNQIVRFTLTKNMLYELEDCYKDIMAACYFLLIRRDDVSIDCKESIINSKQSGEFVGFATSLSTRKFEYTVSFSLHHGHSHGEMEIKIFTYDENEKAISLNDTEIDKSALVESLKKLIHLMECGRDVEISDRLVVLGDYYSKLTYKVLDTKPVNKPAHAETVKSEPINSEAEKPKLSGTETKENSAKTNKSVYMSVASADFTRVTPIVNKIREKGYSVLCNMDIVEHGSTSKSKIMMSETLYMDACDFYLVFISNEYINNYPHNDEMNYILSLKKKKCIPVYLENVELPFDLRLFIGRNKNAVRKYEYDNEQDFYNELFGVGRLETQISEPKPELVEKPEPIEKSEPIEKLETVEKPEPVQKSEIVEEPEKTEPKLWEEGAPENTAFNESWGEDEKYIFASYAHNDKEVVMPILEELRKRGYRVWYDNNIIPGSEWPTEIANKILQCEIFMAFVSSSYNNSKNCGNELYYSAKYYKTSLIVYIEDIELPPGMDLTVSQSQAVYKFKEVTDDAFYKRLFAAKGISECRKQ